MRVLPNPRHRRSPRNLTLNLVFPEWADGHGIFSMLANTENLPWAAISPLGLDIAYHGQRSGEKFIAPMLYNWIDEDNPVKLTDAGYAKLVSALLAVYGQKWNHLWSIYTKEYDPLHTYTITETGSDERTTDRDYTDTNTKDLSTTDTYEESGTDNNTRTPNLTDNQLNKVYGFNSSAGVNESEATATHTGTETNAGTNTSESTNTNEQTGTDTYVKDETVDEAGSYEKTRTGNVYRSPSELLSFDREFWLVDYFSIIFKDIDEMLTLAVYSESPINTIVF